MASSRISSGKNARPAEYPWTVFIRGFKVCIGELGDCCFVLIVGYEGRSFNEGLDGV